jgi:hypothetical protein
MNNVIDAPPQVLAQQAQAGTALAQQPAQGAIQGAGHAIPQQPLSVIEQAIRTGANADQLERLLQLQVAADNHRLDLMREQRRMAEEDRAKAAKAAFLRDLAGFRGENIVIPKSKYVDRGRAGSFMQAEYGTAAAMLSPALSKHGFSFRHDMKFGSKRWMTEGVESDAPWVYVTCYLEHRDGHSDKLDLDGPPGDMSANTPVQNMQVTASYLKRQSLLAITGTATQDEDDENKVGNKRRPAQQADGADQGPDEALLDAGRAAALNGMAALNKWWASLNPRQQKDMGQDFGAMRKAARQADEGAQR